MSFMEKQAYEKITVGCYFASPLVVDYISALLSNSEFDSFTDFILPVSCQ